MEPDSNNGTDIPVLLWTGKQVFPSDFIGFDYEKSGTGHGREGTAGGISKHLSAYRKSGLFQ